MRVYYIEMALKFNVILIVYRYHVQQKFQRSVEMPLGVSEDGRKLRVKNIISVPYFK